MRQLVNGERGFTLLEVMISVVLLTFGLLAVASVLPTGLGLGLYGKDQTKSTSLAQQEIECLRNIPTTGTPVTGVLQGAVGDYGAARSSGTPTVCNLGTPQPATMTTYFDQGGGVTTAANAYFTRDVQVQYWTWNSTSQQFVLAASPYSSTAPSGNWVFRVSVATHWLVHGQTLYKSGQTSPNLNGCAIGSTAYTVGAGCVTASTFISP